MPFFDDVETEIDLWRNQVLLRDIRRYIRKTYGKDAIERTSFIPFSHGRPSRLALPKHEPWVAVVDYDEDTENITVFFDTEENYKRITGTR